MMLDAFLTWQASTEHWDPTSSKEVRNSGLVREDIATQNRVAATNPFTEQQANSLLEKQVKAATSIVKAAIKNVSPRADSGQRQRDQPPAVCFRSSLENGSFIIHV
jgi:hypothetical protein